ncbi:MAG: MASE1 domain-containing protein [Hyphomicrobiaceae bacterium]
MLLPSVNVMARDAAKHIIFGVLYLCGYVLLYWVSFVHPFGSFGIMPWNPSTGLSFVVVLLCGRRMLPLIFVGMILANFIARAVPASIWIAVAEASIVTGGYSAALLALMHPKLRFDPSLQSARDLFLLMAAAIAGSVLVACTSVAVLIQMELLGVEDAVRAGLRYWLGDMIGIAVVAPFGLLVLTRRRLLKLSWETLLQMGSSILLTLWIVEIFAESHEVQLFYLLFVPVTWIALRAGLEGIAAALVFIQVGLFVEMQIFAGRSIDAAYFQPRMLILAVTGLIAGALVTERRHAEVRLRMNQDALARVARLGSMGELAAAIAHEINQPLSAAGTYTGLIVESLQAQAVPNSGLVETARKASEQVTRAADVVRRLRTLVRLGRSEVTPTPVALIVEEAVEAARSAVERHNIVLEVDLPGDLPPVMADRLQIEQVLLNLIRNAAEAIADAKHGTGQIAIRAARNSPGFVDLSVRDTGPGFPAVVAIDELPPFLTTKTDGLGIGLSLCRSIAKAHGGELRIRSERTGATVTISLPVPEISKHG